MKTITLPNDLGLETDHCISIYDYRSQEELSKQQILLNRNTFSFLQEGNKEVFFNNSSYSIDNGQFLLMKSGHCLMTEKLSKESEHYRSILFFFSAEDVHEFSRKYELEAKQDSPYYSTYSFDYDSFIQRFVESLIEISQLSATLRQRMLKTKFDEIMLYLIELNGLGFLQAMVQESSESQKFIQTIESNKLNKLSVEELAFLSNMSISKFKREFQKHFDNSPSRWFQEKRLEHSAYLLKEKSKRASDIYEEIGYENLSNFIQAFKNKFGQTPKQFQSS